MKVSRLFTIDVEVAEMLSKQENQSNFVNTALKERLAIYNEDKSKQEIEEKKQLSGKLKALKIKIRVRNALKSLEIDEKAVNWIKGNYPNIDEEAFYRYMRSRGRKADLKKVIEIFKKNEWLLKE